MNRIRTAAAAAASTALLGAGVLLAAPAAHADEPTEPCAGQATKVEKAEDALARVTAVFEKQATKVKKAKKEVRQADNRSEKAKARQELREAKVKKERVAKEKKAQKQRLAKAQERYDACMADASPAA